MRTKILQDELVTAIYSMMDENYNIDIYKLADYMGVPTAADISDFANELPITSFDDLWSLMYDYAMYTTSNHYQKEYFETMLWHGRVGWEEAYYIAKENKRTKYRDAFRKIETYMGDLDGNITGKEARIIHELKNIIDEVV